MSNVVPDFTLTVPLTSADHRRALVELADAMVATEEAIRVGATSQGLGIAHMKPDSAPPKGNITAAQLSRNIVRKVHYITEEVAVFESKLDPAYRRRSRTFRVEVREAKQREREESERLLLKVYRPEVAADA